jgi:hypothetical protein
MSDRIAFVALQIERLRAHWPNIPVTDVALDEWVDIFRGFSESEVRAAVTLTRDTWGEQGSPKPKHVIANLIAVRGDKPHTFSPAPDPNAPLCPECGTRETLWDIGITDGRNGPAHKPGCSHENERPGTSIDDLTRFREERAGKLLAPSRGLANIADVKVPV